MTDDAVETGRHSPPDPQTLETSRIYPLGDAGLLIRFADVLNEAANLRAIAAAKILIDAELHGVTEICPNLVSVLVKYDRSKIEFLPLSGEISLVLSAVADVEEVQTISHRLAVNFGGKDGPDLEHVAQLCDMSVTDFKVAHCSSPLRVLATGFAPGFVYCGMHVSDLIIPRRTQIHSQVKAGSVLFAAGQTAICATQIPTGWHVIGRTDFMNFSPDRSPPTVLNAGEHVQFHAVESL